MKNWHPYLYWQKLCGLGLQYLNMFAYSWITLTFAKRDNIYRADIVDWRKLPKHATEIHLKLLSLCIQIQIYILISLTTPWFRGEHNVRDMWQNSEIKYCFCLVSIENPKSQVLISTCSQKRCIQYIWYTIQRGHHVIFQAQYTFYGHAQS